MSNRERGLDTPARAARDEDQREVILEGGRTRELARRARGLPDQVTLPVMPIPREDLGGDAESGFDAKLALAP